MGHIRWGTYGRTQIGRHVNLGNSMDRKERRTPPIFETWLRPYIMAILFTYRLQDILAYGPMVLKSSFLKISMSHTF